MIGLDTNVLVRYLVRDDRKQANRAREVIDDAAESGEGLFLDVIVLSELVWVLESAYAVPRSEVARILERLLRTKQLEVERRESVWRALGRYRDGRGDLADHLIGEVNLEEGCRETVTLDRDLDGAPGFRVPG